MRPHNLLMADDRPTLGIIELCGGIYEHFEGCFPALLVKNPSRKNVHSFHTPPPPLVNGTISFL
jgi:hypothetical protein